MNRTLMTISCISGSLSFNVACNNYTHEQSAPNFPLTIAMEKQTFCWAATSRTPSDEDEAHLLAPAAKTAGRALVLRTEMAAARGMAEVRTFLKAGIDEAIVDCVVGWW